MRKIQYIRFSNQLNDTLNAHKTKYKLFLKSYKLYFLLRVILILIQFCAQFIYINLL